jgi:hypothetical protein
MRSAASEIRNLPAHEFLNSGNSSAAIFHPAMILGCISCLEGDSHEEKKGG